MARVRMGLVGLLIISVAGCSSSSLPAGSPVASPVAAVVIPPTTAPSLAAPTVAPTPAPSQAPGWRVIPISDALGPNTDLRDLTTFRGSLVAIGQTGDSGGSGVILSSADGAVWRSIGGTAPLGGLFLRAVAAGDPGIVVVGDSDPTGGGAVVLFSPDGVSWSREPLPDSNPTFEIESVAYREGRFVAVGWPNRIAGSVVSWLSDDGRLWKPVSIIADGSQAQLNSVAAGPAGFVVDGTIPGHGAVWFSTTGATWSRVDLPITDKEYPGRMRYAGGRFFTTGLWSSTDGRHWSSTTLPSGFGEFDVAAMPGGFVAVGRSSEGNQPGVMATAGADPIRWTLQPVGYPPDGALILAVLVSPNGAYLVGVGSSPSPSNGSVFLLADPSVLVRP